MTDPREMQRRKLRADLLCASLLGAGTVALLGAGSAVRAQGTSPEVMQLPSIVVQEGPPSAAAETRGYVAPRATSGTKTDAAVTEAPQSISTVTRDQLDQQTAQSLNEALRYTSGVVPEARGAVALRYDLLTIRGFDPNYYLNGLRLLSNGQYLTPQIDPYLLQRIEVLKGPSSILYGSAAAGGLIDQASRLPQTSVANQIGIEFGNNRHRQANFDSTGPLDKEGHWLYRLTGIGRSEDGQVLHTQAQRIAIAPALTYTPDDTLRITLLGMYQHDPRGGSYGSVPPEGSALPNPNGRLPTNFYDGDTGFERFNRTQASLGYQVEKRLGESVTLYATGRWFHLEQNYASVYSSALQPDLRTLARGTAVSTGASDQFTLDNHARIDVQTGPLSHTVLVGFDYQHLNAHENAGFNYLAGTTPSLDILAPNHNQAITEPARSRTDLNMNQFGVYLQDQIRFGRFLLTLSGRQDLADQQTRAASLGTEQRQYDTAFTSRAGLTYLLDNGLAPYVSYSESFTPTPGAGGNGKAFEPERAHQYEIGVKYQPPGQNSLYTAAIFDLTRNNLLTADPSGVPGLSVQTGAARSRGAELEARLNVAEKLNLILNYTYLETKYTKDNTGLQGQYLPAVPQHLASAWATYELPEGPAEGLSIGGGARYTGITYAYADAFKLRDYVLVDGTLRYDLGRKFPQAAGAQLYLNVKNMLNEKYVASCFYAGWCTYGYGRQVLGGMTYKF